MRQEIKVFFPGEMGLKKFVYLSVMVATFILGLMLAFQFRATSAGDNTPPGREQELAQEKKQLIEDLAQLQKEVADLSAKLEQVNLGQTQAKEVFKEELDKMKCCAGLVPLSGPGVKVIIKGNSPEQEISEVNPNSNLITDLDILKIVNELFSAGAEAVAVNGQRILAVSEIRLAGNHININAVPISAPYHVFAVGDGGVLKSRLEIKEGLVELLRSTGISVVVEEVQHLMIPGYTGQIYFQYAAPVQNEK
ncbi:MAG: hypothetical protein XD97_0136 [Pelotomaculum thermopropionicum]|uniref:Division initiation protein n=1 Tax=Pelotomaculum thermopropionicum TaxID=110500 RepID=A0A101HVY7_9FIRM|nr:MAG: hypothetical protein XD97_0136 [Pelotomaculum thermopropionicum]